MNLAAFKPSRPIKVCVFAGYGTLFDMGALLKACGKSLCDKAAGGKARELVHLWRQKQEELARAVKPTDGGADAGDFWHLTGAALDAAMDSLKIKNAALRARLMQAYMSVQTFPKARAVLQKLKDAGLKTAVLSNASATMLTSVLQRAGMVSLFDHVFPARDVAHSYKPDLIVYQRLAESLQLAPQEICYVASDEADLAAAQQAGFATWAVFPEAEGMSLPDPERGGVNLASLEQLPDVLAA